MDIIGSASRSSIDPIHYTLRSVQSSKSLTQDEPVLLRRWRAPQPDQTGSGLSSRARPKSLIFIAEQPEDATSQPRSARLQRCASEASGLHGEKRLSRPLSMSTLLEVDWASPVSKDASVQLGDKGRFNVVHAAAPIGRRVRRMRGSGSLSQLSQLGEVVTPSDEVEYQLMNSNHFEGMKSTLSQSPTRPQLSLEVLPGTCLTIKENTNSSNFFPPEETEEQFLDKNQFKNNNMSSINQTLPQVSPEVFPGTCLTIKANINSSNYFPENGHIQNPGLQSNYLEHIIGDVSPMTIEEELYVESGSAYIQEHQQLAINDEYTDNQPNLFTERKNLLENDQELTSPTNDELNIGSTTAKDFIVDNDYNTPDNSPNSSGYNSSANPPNLLKEMKDLLGNDQDIGKQSESEEKPILSISTTNTTCDQVNVSAEPTRKEILLNYVTSTVTYEMFAQPVHEEQDKCIVSPEHNEVNELGNNEVQYESFIAMADQNQLPLNSQNNLEKFSDQNNIKTQSVRTTSDIDQNFNNCDSYPAVKNKVKVTSESNWSDFQNFRSDSKSNNKVSQEQRNIETTSGNDSARLKFLNHPESPDSRSEAKQENNKSTGKSEINVETEITDSSYWSDGQVDRIRPSNEDVRVMGNTRSITEECVRENLGLSVLKDYPEKIVNVHLNNTVTVKDSISENQHVGQVIRSTKESARDFPRSTSDTAENYYRSNTTDNNTDNAHNYNKSNNASNTNTYESPNYTGKTLKSRDLSEINNEVKEADDFESGLLSSDMNSNHVRNNNKNASNRESDGSLNDVSEMSRIETKCSQKSQMDYLKPPEPSYMTPRKVITSSKPETHQESPKNIELISAETQTDALRSYDNFDIDRLREERERIQELLSEVRPDTNLDELNDLRFYYNIGKTDAMLRILDSNEQQEQERRHRSTRDKFSDSFSSSEGDEFLLSSNRSHRLNRHSSMGPHEGVGLIENDRLLYILRYGPIDRTAEFLRLTQHTNLPSVSNRHFYTAAEVVRHYKACSGRPISARSRPTVWGKAGSRISSAIKNQNVFFSKLFHKDQNESCTESPYVWSCARDIRRVSSA